MDKIWHERITSGHTYGEEESAIGQLGALVIREKAVHLCDFADLNTMVSKYMTYLRIQRFDGQLHNNLVTADVTYSWVARHGETVGMPAQ